MWLYIYSSGIHRFIHRLINSVAVNNEKKNHYRSYFNMTRTVQQLIKQPNFFIILILCCWNGHQNGQHK